jgi:hypothetical protein
MVSRRTLILFLTVFLFACRPATAPPPSNETQTSATQATAIPATATTAPDEVKEIRNGQYQLGAADVPRFVQLTNGKFDQGTQGGPDYVSVSMTDFIAVGDLTGDGKEEVAALVSENYGGSGVFVFLAVYQNVEGKLSFQTSTLVDDRPKINALSIKNGEISLDMVIHGSNDPMCCPTLRTTRQYRFVDNLLDMTNYTTFTSDGKPQTIKIESPEDGAQVFSSVPIKGSVAITPAEKNLMYHIYDVSGIELSAGQIPVTVAKPGGQGTFDALIPLGKVLSGAVIRIEVQDTDAADASLLAMDSVELVVK